MQSPFKFLDPYTLEDRDIFFGREPEIEALYEMVFESNLVLVYGESGTGKTSLVRCGLASRFQATDWLDIYIRRKDNINTAIREALKQKASRMPMKDNMSLPQMVQTLFLNYFRPIYLIFDQFEELFILDENEKEKREFLQSIRELLQPERANYNTNINCKVILVIREEYLGKLYDFEKTIPYLFEKRLRVERMRYEKVYEVIEKTCEKSNITIPFTEQDRVELLDSGGQKVWKKVITNIIDNISSGRSGVQLSYMQVYLDRLWQTAFLNK
jgi:ABC-type oligopeptide transport system ATPase subunit